MDKYLTKNSGFRKSNNNHKHSTIPKITINPHYNITIYPQKIFTSRNNNKLENRLINTEITQTYNNHNFNFRKTSDISNNYLFKTICAGANSSLKHNVKIKKALFLKMRKNKYPKAIGMTPKIKTKILNDFFNPESTQKYQPFLTPKKIPKLNSIYNCSSENKREMSQYNYLYYFFPNLFNVPNNRIEGISKLNASKFFIAPIPSSSFNEEVKSLKVIRFNHKDNDNGKSLYPSIITNNKEENNDKKNPIFIQKKYNIDVLKNVRFGFKNSVEKGKLNHLIKSFYIEKNLNFSPPKSP